MSVKASQNVGKGGMASFTETTVLLAALVPKDIAEVEW